MFKSGLLLFLTAVLIALPVSFFVPILGALFIFTFPDLILVSLALMLSGITPLKRSVRIILVILMWLVGSLAIEAQRLPQLLSLGSEVLKPISSISRPVVFNKDKPLPIFGQANAFVAAAGPAMFFTADIHQVGVRESSGRSLINQATTVELVDMLWERGYQPSIDLPVYPRLTVKRINSQGWGHLSITVEDVPGQIASVFKRSFPLPLPAPGLQLNSFSKLLLSVLHDNLLRTLLGLNRQIDPYREISSFLDQVLNSPKARSPIDAPTHRLRVIQDIQVPLILDKFTNAQSFLEQSKFDVQRTNASSQDDGYEWLVDACGRIIKGREYGSAGYRSYVSVFDSQGDKFPELVTHISPGHATFDYVCDRKTGRLLTFMDLGQILRVSAYASNGQLTRVKFYQLPTSLNRYAVIDRNSLQLSDFETSTHFSFSVLHPVNAPKGSTYEFARNIYRRIDLAEE